MVLVAPVPGANQKWQRVQRPLVAGQRVGEVEAGDIAAALVAQRLVGVQFGAGGGDCPGRVVPRVGDERHGVVQPWLQRAQRGLLDQRACLLILLQCGVDLLDACVAAGGAHQHARGDGRIPGLTGGGKRRPDEVQRICVFVTIGGVGNLVRQHARHHILVAETSRIDQQGGVASIGLLHLVGVRLGAGEQEARRQQVGLALGHQHEVGPGALPVTMHGQVGAAGEGFGQIGVLRRGLERRRRRGIELQRVAQASHGIDAECARCAGADDDVGCFAFARVDMQGQLVNLAWQKGELATDHDIGGGDVARVLGAGLAPGRGEAPRLRHLQRIDHVQVGLVAQQAGDQPGQAAGGPVQRGIAGLVDDRQQRHPWRRRRRRGRVAQQDPGCKRAQQQHGAQRGDPPRMRPPTRRGGHGHDDHRGQIGGITVGRGQGAVIDVQAHQRDPLQAAAIHGADHRLPFAVVVECAPGLVQQLAERGVGDRPVAPQRGDHFLLAQRAVAVLEQQQDQVEDLGLDVDLDAVAIQPPRRRRDGVCPAAIDAGVAVFPHAPSVRSPGAHEPAPASLSESGCLAQTPRQ